MATIKKNNKKSKIPNVTLRQVTENPEENTRMGKTLNVDEETLNSIKNKNQLEMQEQLQKLDSDRSFWSECLRWIALLSVGGLICFLGYKGSKKIYTKYIK